MDCSVAITGNIGEADEGQPRAIGAAAWTVRLRALDRRSREWVALDFASRIGGLIGDSEAEPPLNGGDPVGLPLVQRRDLGGGIVDRGEIVGGEAALGLQRSGADLVDVA